MQRPIAKPIGTPREMLDTPALLVDVERLDANKVTRQGPVRVQAWLHGTPAIAHLELAWPGVIGIAVRGVAEAEAFAAAGCMDIRILRPLVTEQSRRRAQALARSVRVATADDGVPLLGVETLAGAVTVSARVSSTPEPDLAIHDCGQKAIGRDFGDPQVVGHAEWQVRASSAEHGIVRQPVDAPSCAIGDWLELTPADVATTFALHDFAYAIRAGRLDAIWPVSARGAFQ